MPTLYALMSTRTSAKSIPLGPPDSAIEVVDLGGDPKLLAFLPLGNREPTSFAVSQEQQRLYVCDELNSEVVVMDTTGDSVATIPFSSAPRYCVLSPDGARLFVSTEEEIVAIDAATLVKINGIPNPSTYPACLACSPAESEIAALATSVWPNICRVLLIDSDSCVETASFDVVSPNPNTTYGIYDVVFGDAQHLFFHGPEGFIGSVDVHGDQLPWIWFDYHYHNSLQIFNAIAHKKNAARVYVPSGRLRPASQEIVNPVLWSLDPLNGTTSAASGFGGVPTVAAAGFEEEVYVAVRHPNGALTEWDDVPESLFKYDGSQVIQPATYTFSTDTLFVVDMHVTPGTVFDPPNTKEWARSVKVLFGILGGGGGAVIKPDGTIDPVPDEWWFSVMQKTEAGKRALRVAEGARSIRDRRVRDVVRRSAIAYAQKQFDEARSLASRKGKG